MRPDLINIKQIVLKKLQIQASMGVSEHMLNMASIEQISDAVSRELIFQLRTYVTAHSWTEKHSNAIDIKVPLTWLDATRLRFAPKLLAGKYPIKYRTIKSGGDVNNNYWIFPEIPPNPDKHISDFIMTYMERNIYK